MIVKVLSGVKGDDSEIKFKLNELRIYLDIEGVRQVKQMKNHIIIQNVCKW